jgi:hypothetical protein
LKVLIDYLRYVAFRGRLRTFFEDALYNFVDPSITTGQHLRFAPDYLDRQVGLRGQEIISDLYWKPHSRDLILERLKHDIGLAGGPDSLAEPQYQIGSPPSTFVYNELRPPELEIIVDINPDQWTESYSERRSYENTPIIFRRAGPATPNVRSGDKLFDEHRGQSSYGTLCGVFYTTKGQGFALTCGHVAGDRSHVSIEQRRYIWRLPLWPRFTSLGITRYHAMCGPAKQMVSVQTQLDAALIEVGPTITGLNSPKVTRQATIKPISTILQEEPVRFRGGRSLDTLARISAVTVRKSIDLYKDNQLREVGDVLMLGHRQPMFIAQRVSRPGDSGAAIRQDYSNVGPFTELNQWHGMLLGSDEGGAFATYSEHLWAWAAQKTGDLNMDFVFDT